MKLKWYFLYIVTLSLGKIFASEHTSKTIFAQPGLSDSFKDFSLSRQDSVSSDSSVFGEMKGVCNEACGLCCYVCCCCCICAVIKKACCGSKASEERESGSW